MQLIRRAELVEAIGKPCFYCGEPMAIPTRDHIQPRMHGGTLNGSNKALACSRCNHDKGCSTLRKWLKRLRRAGDPRSEIVARLVDSNRLEARPAQLGGPLHILRALRKAAIAIAPPKTTTTTAKETLSAVIAAPKRLCVRLCVG